MARTRAQQNKAIRQEALREQLSAQGHHQHLIEIAQKLDELDVYDKDLADTHIKRLKAKADIHHRLLSKYLPDLKSQEIEATVQASHEDMLAKLEGGK